MMLCLFFPSFFLPLKVPFLKPHFSPRWTKMGKEKAGLSLQCPPFEGNRWHLSGLFLPEGPLFWMVHNSSR